MAELHLPYSTLETAARNVVVEPRFLQLQVRSVSTLGTYWSQPAPGKDNLEPLLEQAMSALLRQPSQPLNIYQPDVEGTKATSDLQQGSVWAENDITGPERKAWLQAVEDKENVDPASGLTVATRRQRRRVLLVQVQVSSPADVVSGEAEDAKCSRTPLKDITADFPEAVVCYRKPSVLSSA